MTNKGRISRQTHLSLYHRTPKHRTKRAKPGQNSQLFSLWSSLTHFSLLTELAMLFFFIPGVWEATSPIPTENSYPTQAVTTWTPGRYHPVQTDENPSHFHSCWDYELYKYSTSYGKERGLSCIIRAWRSPAARRHCWRKWISKHTYTEFRVKGTHWADRPTCVA